MGLIQKPFTHNPSNNNTTPAESAKVNANDDVIYSEFNGNISDANVHPSANIQQSKIQNLPQTLTAINNTIVDIGVAATTTLNTVSTDAGEPGSVAVGEQQLYAPIFVAANTLGTTHYLFLSQDFLVSLLNGSNLQFKYYFGGVAFFTPGISNGSGVTQSLQAVHIDITIRARNSTGGQFAMGRMFMQSTNPLYFTGASGVSQQLNATGIAIDTTTGQYLQTNAVWDSPGNAITGVGSACWLAK